MQPQQAIVNTPNQSQKIVIVKSGINIPQQIKPNIVVIDPPGITQVNFIQYIDAFHMFELRFICLVFEFADYEMFFFSVISICRQLHQHLLVAVMYRAPAHLSFKKHPKWMIYRI